MDTRRKICVLTGSRADYGLLSGLLRAIRDDAELELQLVVTGAHLSPDFGYTWRQIEEDGFYINKKVEMLLSSDSPQGTAKSTGLALIGLSDAFADLLPDIIVLLGDRFETYAAACAALFLRIPCAHIHGGEVTTGAFDDAIRHAITKMSHLHFTSTEMYRRRVIQLGESPARVFNVGALGVENIKTLPLLSQARLEESIGFELGDKCILVTYHPVTLDDNTPEGYFTNLLQAISNISGLRVIFTKANADTHGRVINELIDRFVEENGERCIAFHSMGQIRYLSAMKYVGAVVGNSSSGIIEAPSFCVPIINIGDRQKGRIFAKSIVQCEPEVGEITDSLNKVFSAEFNKTITDTQNLYEQSDTAKKIVEILKENKLDHLVKKDFHDIDE